MTLCPVKVLSLKVISRLMNVGKTQIFDEEEIFFKMFLLLVLCLIILYNQLAFQFIKGDEANCASFFFF